MKIGAWGVSLLLVVCSSAETPPSDPECSSLLHNERPTGRCVDSNVACSDVTDCKRTSICGLYGEAFNIWTLPKCEASRCRYEVGSRFVCGYQLPLTCCPDGAHCGQACP